LPTSTLRVSQTNNAPFRKIQDALNAAPGNSPSPVVIEIQDSHTYSEALVVSRNFPGGLGDSGQRVGNSGSWPSPGGDVLQIGNAISGASFTLDGLTLAGGKITIRGDVPKVKLRFCSLDPATSGIDCQPKNPGTALELDQVITGPVKTSANVAVATLNDTAVQNTAGATALDAAVTAVSLEHVTVVGNTLAQTLMASNAILFGTVTLGDAANSCFRYSCYPKEVTGMKLFRCTTLLPIFSSFQFGHPAYLGLSVNTPAALRRGGEEGGEMGVWYAAGIPWREQERDVEIRRIPAGGAQARSDAGHAANSIRGSKKDMKTDISKLPLKEWKHSLGVFLQMGRVQLDSDWNEQADLSLRLLQRQTEDVVAHRQSQPWVPGR